MRGGVKGRSGRKSLNDERKIRTLMEKGIELTELVISRKGIFKDLKPEFIAEIAAKIAIKAIPQTVFNEGEAIHQVINIIRADNGRNAQKLSGRISVHRSAISGNGIGMGNGKEPLPDPTGS